MDNLRWNSQSTHTLRFLNKISRKNARKISCGYFDFFKNSNCSIKFLELIKKHVKKWKIVCNKWRIPSLKNVGPSVPSEYFLVSKRNNISSSTNCNRNFYLQNRFFKFENLFNIACNTHTDSFSYHSYKLVRLSHVVRYNH